MNFLKASPNSFVVSQLIIIKEGVCRVPEGSGEQRKMEETDCEVICGAPTTLAVKEQVQVKVNLTPSQTQRSFHGHVQSKKITRQSLTHYMSHTSHTLHVTHFTHFTFHTLYTLDISHTLHFTHFAHVTHFAHFTHLTHSTLHTLYTSHTSHTLRTSHTLHFTHFVNFTH